MGTFTISQSQPGQEVWLYPSGNGCLIELTPIGEANNWQCVDELKDDTNEDTDYVASSDIAAKKDLYLTAESIVSNLAGTINYVQIYARAKSHLYPQHEDGIFKIFLTLNPSGCTEGDFYKSSDKGLITSYSTVNHVWNLNPLTSLSWVWADIENLEIGVEVSSPTLTDYQVGATFRPNAVGDKTECILNNPLDPLADNYEMVDEANPNKNTNRDTIYNWDGDGGGATKTDLYHIPNHTTEAGTIISVSVFYMTLRESDTDGEAAAIV